MHVMNMLYKTGNLINLTIITLKLKCKLSTVRKIHIRAIPLKCPSRPVDFLLDAVSFLIIHSLVYFVNNHAWSFIGLIFYFQIVKGEQTGVVLIF